MDINQNQKAVSPTLRETLEEDLYWNADRADQRMKALRSAIVRELTVSANGSLYRKISIGEDKALLSFSFFTKALSKPGLLPVARGNKFDLNSSLSIFYDTSNHDTSKEMTKARNKTVKFLNIAFEYVEDNFPDIYKKEQYFILSNRGVFAFIRLLGGLLIFESNNSRLNPNLKPEEIFKKIEKYVHAFLEGINNLSESEAESILVILGGGAETAWFMSFQDLVNKTYPEFFPDDLAEWKEKQDEGLQSEGRSLGIEIESFIKSKVLQKLKQIYGNDWDIAIGSIQRQCETRAQEQIEKDWKDGLGRKKIEWTEMFFITDYKDIIYKNWTKIPEEKPVGFKTFEDDFAIDIGMEFNSKDKKLKWLMIFNSYRNLWAHEGTKEKRLNKKEVYLLKQIHTSLIS